MRYATPAAAALLPIGMLILAAGACTDLNETVYDQITQKNFKPTANDLGSLIAPAYLALADMYMGWYGNVDVAQEEPADMLVTPERINGWWDGGVYYRQHTHSWTLNSYTFTHTWSNCFSSINNVNRVIYQIESGTIPLASDSAKTGILAELRALRAYDYSLLLDNFRNVPIVTDFTAKDLPKQNTGQEVFDFVVSELSAAIPNLSAETGVATYGRMNRWAAEAILARVYLNAEVYVGTPSYNKVIPLTQDIIDSGKYTLDPSYRIPFSVAAGPLDGGKSHEVIWAVPYDAVYLPVSSFHMKTLKPELKFVFNMINQPWGGSAGNPQFVATYDPDDTRKQDTWLMGPHFTRDSAFGYNFTDTIPQFRGKNDFRYGFPVWKYEIYAGETGSSNVDYPIIRYAEVLMMQAEALLRTGRADEAAVLVTQVRQRAFAASNPAKATVTGADLMQGSRYLYGWYDTDGIVKTAPGGTPVTATTGGAFGGADIQYGRFLDELAWEFAVEGQRRQQLIRFGVFSTKAWFNHPADADTHWRVYPIPQFAIDANPNLRQNPGY
jgi:starch-binding outer membrane protein, SusD/RagB family